MSNQKEYKILKLSYLDGISPTAEYLNGNKTYSTKEEARKGKPKDTPNTIYLIIELEDTIGDPSKRATIAN